MTASLDTRLVPLRLLVLDVDGVLTDGRFTLDADGRESKTFHTQDGFGLRQLQRAGIELAIITGRRSGAVSRRTEELGIEHVFQGVSDKAGAMADLIARTRLSPPAIAACGDDIPDLAMFDAAGVGIAVANAVDAVRTAADWVTERRGGYGAVREIADRILAARGG